MPDNVARVDLLNTLELALRAWIKNPSWGSFQPVSKILKQLEETKMNNESR